MPTNRFGKVRRLLKNKLAYVVKRIPFTIKLNYETTNFIQQVNLGIDSGSRHIGISVTTDKKELYASDVEIRNDIVEKLSTRKQLRKCRRQRLRYRKPRFINRTSSKKEGWIAPSIKNKIQTHLNIVEVIFKFIPISNIIVETASFDIQKINNKEIYGDDYRKGEQFGFWNTREYVLFRDNHECQYCYGKSKDRILNVHHIESRKTGGNSPGNLITLCKTCHDLYHNNKIILNITRKKTNRDSSFMNIMKWKLFEELKKRYNNVYMTFGYITKKIRIDNFLPKEHYVDARCISGNPMATPLGFYYYQKKVRCHNRQIHKSKILKGGKKKNNQADFLIKGFRLFDLVEYQKKLYYIFGRRNSGFFDIRKLDGTKINKGSVNCKYLKLIDIRKSVLTERRSSNSTSPI